MKKILAIVALSLSPILGFGQELPNFSDYGTATIDENHCVHLDDTKPIERYYSIDFSHLNFENETEAFTAFGMIANNLLTYSVYFDEQKAVLLVHTDRTLKREDIVWWNNYLESLCDK